MFIKDKGNLKVSKHYYIMRNCLKGCLRDLFYNVLLIFMFIYKLLLVILFVTINKKGFKVSACKDLV
jgi:hypothetical protein